MVGGKVGASDPTNSAYLAKVETLIAELGVADQVQWTGFTAPEDVSANLLAADCAVLPYREGASLRHGSLMAALVHGLPIISTEVPAEVRAGTGLFPMLVDGQNALLAPPDDPERLAAGRNARDDRSRLASAPGGRCAGALPLFRVGDPGAASPRNLRQMTCFFFTHGASPGSEGRVFRVRVEALAL